VKVTLAKEFLLILIAGLILLALIAAGAPGLPEPLPTLRILLGIFFVLFIPGFAIQTALFPGRSDLDPLVRAGFSFGLSIAVIPLAFLVLDALGLGIQFWSIALLLTLIILASLLMAVIRRRRLPETEKVGFNLSLDVRGWWASQDRVFRVLYIILALALVTATVSGVAVSLEKPGKPFTEFYLLDSQGLSEDYPREATAGKPIVFNLGIANHEGQPGQYNIVAVRAGAQSTALATAGPVSLADGAVWQGSLTFAMAQAGDGQEVEFLLERVGSPWPYRTLRVWVNVDALRGNTSWHPILVSSIVTCWQSVTEKPSDNSRV